MPRILLAATLRADAGAADEDAAIGLAALDRHAEPLREVRVVVGRVGAVAAEVDEVVARGRAPEPPNQLVLEPAPAWSAAKATRIRRHP